MSASTKQYTNTRTNFASKDDNDKDFNIKKQKCHLIVLSHGLWGTSEHFAYMEATMENHLSLKYPDKKFYFYKTKSNEKFKTYDGIDLCGARVAEEIFIETKRLKKLNFEVDEFSMIGYSLGGLIARYAIGILTYKDYFKNEITPMNFTTFCTPHVGVLTPGNTISVKLFNLVVPTLLGNTGKQMFLKDDVSNGKSLNSIPLLVLMSSENSIFYKGLGLFKKISLYSNIRADIRTSWWSSGISYINPFEILDKNPLVNIDENGFINFKNGSKFELSFVDKYSPIILDVEKEIKFKGLVNYDEEKRLLKNMPKTKILESDTETYIQNFFIRKFKWLVLIFRTFIYLPMWITWFILNNCLQVTTSGYRVIKESSKLKECGIFYNIVDQVTSTVTGASPIQSSSTTPLLKPTLVRTLSDSYAKELSKLENDLHDQGDSFLDSVFDAITSSDKVNESIFDLQSLQLEHGDRSLITSISKLCSVSVDDIDDWETDFKKLGRTKREAFEYYQVLKPFKLGLSKNQREIVNNLNKLKWHKFPIYITKTNSTHAAAIVRHTDPNFEEGKVVVQHFCNEVLIV